MPIAADFASARRLKVLEIGCGIGTDGAQFAEAGAEYTGVDLTEAAVELARKRFELFNLPGKFQTADAEDLPFPAESFDVVYSHGVLHHTPETKKAIQEIHRVLRPGGRAIVMLYHRDSYNYRINISLLRRAGARLLKSEKGIGLIHKITGEPLDSLREHARLLKSEKESYLKPAEFLNQNTDGAGNPLARVYSRTEARELFKDFSKVVLKTYFLNKRWLPLVGKILPRPVESRLASRWGWHLWIYATK
ncbi:MAG TPA: class I SAM-dependent methyltransferase [Pyrinomonadaceae bacterium]|nr:class I SAM-dependent methyltransferase [Pyrinomonadaceae bacterium]